MSCKYFCLHCDDFAVPLLNRMYYSFILFRSVLQLFFCAFILYVPIFIISDLKFYLFAIYFGGRYKVLIQVYDYNGYAVE